MKKFYGEIFHCKNGSELGKDTLEIWVLRGIVGNPPAMNTTVLAAPHLGKWKHNFLLEDYDLNLNGYGYC